MAYVKIDLDTLNKAKDTLIDVENKINALACMFESASQYKGEIKFDLSASKGAYLILNEVVKSIHAIAFNELNGEEIAENLAK